MGGREVLEFMEWKKGSKCQHSCKAGKSGIDSTMNAMAMSGVFL